MSEELHVHRFIFLASSNRLITQSTVLPYQLPIPCTFNFLNDTWFVARARFAQKRPNLR